MKSTLWVISLLITMTTVVHGASSLDTLVKNIHNAKTYEEFEVIFKTVKWQTDIFANEDVKKGLIELGFNKNYIKVFGHFYQTFMKIFVTTLF